MNLPLKLISMLILVGSSEALEIPQSNQIKCHEKKIHGMLNYICNDMKLEKVPEKIRSTVEVLELQHNRIREIDSKSFESCPDVKFIYLQYNILSEIGEGTFSRLQKLEVLDLSENALSVIPGEIFELPLLRNLYLERNILRPHSFDTIPNPIKAPLKKLSIAKNKLDVIPSQFGILPDLFHLNISNNFMRNLTLQHFAPLCNLKEVDLKNTEMEECQCKEIVEFLTKKRRMKIFNLTCNESKACQETTIAVDETQEFMTCIDMAQQLTAERRAKSTWKIIGISVLSFVIIFILILCCVSKNSSCNSKPKKKERSDEQPLSKISEKISESINEQSNIELSKESEI